MPMPDGIWSEDAPRHGAAWFCHARGLSTALLSAESQVIAKGLGLPPAHAYSLEGIWPGDLELVLWWHDAEPVRVSLTEAQIERCAWTGK